MNRIYQVRNLFNATHCTVVYKNPSKVILVNNGAVSGIKKVSELVDSIHNIYEITVNTDTFEELRKDIFIIRIKVIDGGMIVRYHGPKVEGATEVNSNLEDYFIVKGD